MLLYFLFVYYVVVRVPQGIVDTSLRGNVLTVGDQIEILPKHIDTSTMCAVKRNGFLLFKFNEFSSSF